MLLILTCTEDVTTDLLIPHLAGLPVFRFNIDRYEDYDWDFSGSRFSIAHRDGLTVTSETIRALYLRKPLFFERIDVPKDGSLVNWAREEVTEIMQNLYYTMAALGRCPLVHPGKGKWRKPRQMALAETLFRIPEWHVFHGPPTFGIGGRRWVVKSLTQTPVGEGKTLFVKEAEPVRLDTRYPWFVQEKVEAEEDVTVVYVKGKVFSYALDRRSFGGDDYRFDGAFNELPWKRTSLSERDRKGMRRFMRETGYSFGRFDFLRKGGELFFLEMNPNGQWAWLDGNNQDGLFTSISQEIIRVASMPTQV